ncbi:hypothetical protein [Paenibacillus sp. NEAU-GSW1]|uniref:hypothetical protein n=1 Tax=Paenibacillus sp. NEAU-GSW1 TaxID=2682486 RepID=UPI001566A76A|nr:hypothetical protein [Paenibacillus sp. NEAU-GSW1]
MSLNIRPSLSIHRGGRLTSPACAPGGSRAAGPDETAALLIELLADAQEAEGRAIEAIKHFMRETLEIREGDIALR